MYGLCLMICTLNSFITSSLLNKEEQLGPELYRIPSGVWTRFLTLRGTGGTMAVIPVLLEFSATLEVLFGLVDICMYKYRIKERL